MLEGYLKSGKGIGCIDRGGPKNPCVFGEQYFPELRSLSGDVGGKKVLCRHPEDVYRQKAEKEEVWDMDEKRTVIVRGGGDLATGTSYLLAKRGLSCSCAGDRASSLYSPSGGVLRGRL